MCATGLGPSQGVLHLAGRLQLFLVLPFSQFSLTFFMLEKQATRRRD
jgi:hypothetical protein